MKIAAHLSTLYFLTYLDGPFLTQNTFHTDALIRIKKPGLNPDRVLIAFTQRTVEVKKWYCIKAVVYRVVSSVDAYMVVLEESTQATNQTTTYHGYMVASLCVARDAEGNDAVCHTCRLHQAMRVKRRLWVQRKSAAFFADICPGWDDALFKQTLQHADELILTFHTARTSSLS